jgi:hypothetical protein
MGQRPSPGVRDLRPIPKEGIGAVRGHEARKGSTVAFMCVSESESTGSPVNAR